MVWALGAVITKVPLTGTQQMCAIRFLCHACVRVVCLVMLPWFGLLKFFLSCYLLIGQRMIKWSMIAISAPLRLIMASQREKLLQSKLEEMACMKEDLGKELDIVIKDCKHIETLLIEVKEEKDRANEKLQHLHTRVQDVESENLKLKEMESTLPKAEESEVRAIGRETKYVQHANGKQTTLQKQYGESFMPEGREWYCNFERKGNMQSDCFMDEADVYHNSNERNQLGDFLLQSRVKSFAHFSMPSNSCSKKLTKDGDLLYQWRRDALAQCFFSTFLSLLVGMIAQESQDPCFPLVIALFIVVGMSSRSVTRLFSRIENRPGLDAVALLSFNWFILGTIASPTLPVILQLTAPLASELAYLLAGWIGLSIR